MGEVISMEEFRGRPRNAGVADKIAEVAKAPPVSMPASPLVLQDGETTVMNYGLIVEEAMIMVLRRTLSEIAQHGKPTNCQLYITFNTQAEHVDMPGWLKAQHQGVMTIMLDEWFKDLVVGVLGFDVTLNFGDTPVRMRIPYRAVTEFVDRPVEFGVRFGGHLVPDEQPEPPAPLIA